MHHLTNFYKHRCEQLQEQVNHLQKMLNEWFGPGGMYGPMNPKQIQFLNRYMNVHSDHDLVKSDPMEAKSLILSAYPHVTDHDEATFLTRNFLDKTLSPQEPDQIKQILGTWRSARDRNLIGRDVRLAGRSAEAVGGMFDSTPGLNVNNRSWNYKPEPYGVSTGTTPIRAVRAYQSLAPYYRGTIKQGDNTLHVYNFANVAKPDNNFRNMVSGLNGLFIGTDLFHKGFDESYPHWKSYNRGQGISMLVDPKEHTAVYYHANVSSEQPHVNFAGAYNMRPDPEIGADMHQQITDLLSGGQPSSQEPPQNKTGPTTFGNYPPLTGDPDDFQEPRELDAEDARILRNTSQNIRLRGPEGGISRYFQ